MADPNRKRSRKSRLVPRNLESDAEVDAEREKRSSLQALTRLNSAMASSQQAEDFLTPSEDVGFDVQVEIECENLGEPSVSSHPPNNVFIAQGAYVKTRDLRREVERLMKTTTDPADKILEVEIRNSWGRLLKAVPQTPLDTALQEIFSSWRIWNGQSRLRDVPFLYKCYTCDVAFWHLQPFKDHLQSEHQDMNLLHESFNHEFNVIAWEGDRELQPKMRPVQIVDGDCYRCLKSPREHAKDSRSYYYCQGCRERFSACAALFAHEGKCHRYLRILVHDGHVIHEHQYKCNICNIDCITEKRYEAHMIGRHSVRNDCVIYIPMFKICILCGMKHFSFLLHTCWKKPASYQCSFCFRKYHTRQLLHAHAELATAPSRCRACDHFMPRPCMHVEHVVQHTRTYALAYQCSLCKETLLFPSERSVNIHLRNDHHFKDKKREYREVVVVPKSVHKLPQLELPKFKGPPNRGFRFAKTGDTTVPEKQLADDLADDAIELHSEIKIEPEEIVIDESDNDGNSMQDDEEQCYMMEKEINSLLKHKKPRLTGAQKGMEELIETEIIDNTESMLICKTEKKDVTERVTETSDDLDDDCQIISLEEECSMIEGEIMEIFNQSAKDREKNKEKVREGSTERECEEMQNQIDALLQRKKSWFNTGTVTVKNEKDDNECEQIQIEIDSLIKSRDTKIKTEGNRNVKKVEKIVRQSDLITRILTGDSDDSELDECKIIEREMSRKKSAAKKADHKIGIIKKRNKINTTKPRTSNDLEEKDINTCLKEEPVIGEEIKIGTCTKAKDIFVKEIKQEDYVDNTETAKYFNDIVVNTTEKATDFIVNKDHSSDNDKTVDSLNNKITFDLSNVKTEIIDNETSIDHNYVRSWTANNYNDNTIQDDNDDEEGNLEIDEDYDDDDDIIILNHGDYNFVDLTEDATKVENCLQSNEPEFKNELDDKTNASDNSDRDEQYRSMYKCNLCDYIGIHKDYVNHKKSLCRGTKENKSLAAKIQPESLLVSSSFIRGMYTMDDGKIPMVKSGSIWPKLECTALKCKMSFKTMRKYLLHFSPLRGKKFWQESVHDFEYGQCPKCYIVVENVGKLCTHVVAHIKTSFVSMSSISTSAGEKIGIYRCIQCKESVCVVDFFQHWEMHLDVKDPPNKIEVPVTEEVDVEYDLEESNDMQDEDGNVDQLKPEMLEKIIGQLTSYKFSLRAKLHVILKSCVACGRRFNRRNDCKRHAIEHLLRDAYFHKQTNGGLACQICKEVIATAYAYKQHMRCHGGLPIYQCELCNKEFSDSSNFGKHKKVHNLYRLECDICGSKFQKKATIEKHMEVHKTHKAMQCSHCPRVFMLPSVFRKHMKSKHARKGARCGFSCINCRRRFSCLRDKWDHMWEVHNERKQIADCPTCGLRFRKISDVKRHLRDKHGENMSATEIRSKLTLQNDNKASGSTTGNVYGTIDNEHTSKYNKVEIKTEDEHLNVDIEGTGFEVECYTVKLEDLQTLKSTDVKRVKLSAETVAEALGSVIPGSSLFKTDTEETLVKTTVHLKSESSESGSNVTEKPSTSLLKTVDIAETSVKSAHTQPEEPIGVNPAVTKAESVEISDSHVKPVQSVQKTRTRLKKPVKPLTDADLMWAVENVRLKSL